jgi:dienelactone hydrolase
MSKEQIDTFCANLDSAGADWQMASYGGAKHAFTAPEAAERAARGLDALAYSPSADRRSWRAMLDFFHELFAD